MGGDEELVTRALAGEKSARSELVHRHVGAVRATVLARLGPHPEVDDLVQDTMLRGFEQLATLREPERFGAWLRGICRNVCRDYLRQAPRKMASLDDADQVPMPEKRAKDLSPLLRAVSKLPEKLRETLLLFYLDNVSYRELAARLEITTAAVNQRLTRARQLLRDQLEGREALE